MYLVTATSKNSLLSHSDMDKTTCTLLFMTLLNVYYYKKGKKHILNVLSFSECFKIIVERKDLDPSISPIPTNTSSTA